ncbi:Rsp5p-dependent ubiquitination, sorting of cargo proteins at the multivesicular body [Quaeritorhiza haematococci]|nr:Rsp5p-dependent ubiquitination, sorting of cargo proteins at the multivesicular body [Quaeritorhiza haematococci]
MFASYNNASGAIADRAASFQKKNPPPRQTELHSKKVKEIEKRFEKRGHSAWAFAKPSGFSFKSYVTISNSFNIKFAARPAGQDDTDLAVLSSVPMYRDPTVKDRQYFYYECTVVDLAYAPKTTVIGVGVATSPYPSFRLVGWQDYSVGYHSDDGRLFVNDEFGGKIFASPFTKGDTVGVGYDPTRGAVFFTLNGSFLSDATSNEFHPYHAAVSADGACELDINFGQRPFIYQPANPGWTPDKAAAPLGPPPTTTPSTLDSTAPSTSDVNADGVGSPLLSVPLSGPSTGVGSSSSVVGSFADSSPSISNARPSGEALLPHVDVPPYPQPSSGALMQAQQPQQQQQGQASEQLPPYMSMPTPM